MSSRRRLASFAASLLLAACDGAGGSGSLAVDTEKSTVRVVQGGTAELVVALDRADGPAGDVTIEVLGLPVGVGADPVTVAAADGEGTLVIEAANSAEHAGPLAITVRASAADDAAIVDESTVTLYVAGDPGEPDRSLSDDGYVVVEGPVVADEVGTSAAIVDSKGRLVVVGTGQGVDPMIGFAARLLPDGTLDEGFGDGGAVVGFGLPQSACQGLALDGDAPVVLCAVLDGMEATAFFRGLDEAGHVEPSFGIGGDREVPISHLSVTPRSDGLLAWGDAGILAFDSAGDPATGFAPPEPLPVAELGALTVDPQGRLLLGEGALTSTSYTFARLDATGALDEGFAEGGVFTRPAGVGEDEARVLRFAFAPDGSGVALAQASSGVGYFENTVLLLGFTAMGKPDENFGEGGVAMISASGIGWELFRLDDGSLVVVYGDHVDGLPDGKVMRLLSNGTPDPDFGDTGIVDLDFDYTTRIAFDAEAQRLWFLDGAASSFEVRRVWL